MSNIISSHQLSQGMTILINQRLFRVESIVKVNVPKGGTFIKAKLRDLSKDEVVEKSFKQGAAIQLAQLAEQELEFLYPEGKSYLFLDVGDLEQVLVPNDVVGDSVQYLKEGVIVKASSFGGGVYAIELPQFLELMVSKVEEQASDQSVLQAGAKIAILETGAKIEVPQFIEVGDIIKVDTKTSDYVQRV